MPQIVLDNASKFYGQHPALESVHLTLEDNVTTAIVSGESELYKGLLLERKVVWVQEEPANMGALAYIRPILQRRVGGDRHVTTVKRSESASPATGSAKAHALEQQALIKLAFA